MTYEVPGLKLITQDMENSCWYASAQMLLNWRDNRRGGLISHRVDDATIEIYRKNDGLFNEQILPFAKRLGLVAIPPMSPSVAALTRWLQTYGPLWTNGISHIVVIGGIRGGGDGYDGYELKVFDPAPGGGIGWRSLAGWYTGMGADADVDSRDTSDAVEAVFLHA